MYTELNDDYQIIGNQILHLSKQEKRPYVNKANVKLLQEGFDPIRVKLRMIPISRAPASKAMNADYYFIEAGKKAQSGQLTQALDFLRRGLGVTPSHYMCRFNYGVMLFKLGLVIEAAQQF